MSEKPNFDQVFKNVKELHDINFGENGLIQLNDYSKITEDSYVRVSNKDFFEIPTEAEKYNGHFSEKYKVKGCCHLCEDKGCSTPDNDKLKDEKKQDEYKDYKLCYVSHGSHSIDFLRASGLTDDSIKDKFETNNWNTTPIIFLMENPSKDNKDDPFYGKVKGIEKYPTNTWYWIHRQRKTIVEMQKDYESYLKQGYYGEMAYALICKYKLANAYLTNIVKCGMNFRKEEEGKVVNDGYLGTWWYQNDCKINCVEKVLSKEVKALTDNYDRLIVFAFGNNAYWLAKDYLQNTRDEDVQKLNIQLSLLPHPSSRLNNTFRRILLTDYLTKVIDDENIGELNYKQNLLMVDDEIDFKRKLESKFKFRFNEIKRSYTKGNERQVLKLKKDTSLFSKKCKITEIIFKTTNSMQYGYCIDEQYFWAWDEKEKKFIEEQEFENDEFFIPFKKALKEQKII